MYTNLFSEVSKHPKNICMYTNLFSDISKHHKNICTGLPLTFWKNSPQYAYIDLRNTKDINIRQIDEWQWSISHNYK